MAEHRKREDSRYSEDIELHTFRRLASKVVRQANEGPSDSSLEELFLRAAEKGDVDAVSYALQHRGSFDIDCRDKNGDTALQLAVRNSNAEIIRVLLEGGVHPSDSLLRAVDMQNLKMVDIILNFANSPRGQKFDLINSGMDSDDFHPVVTPLILAAQNNNHDIIRALLLNGARLIVDPGINENPSECHTVEYSIGILQIYKALSGEFYIALTSKDPIDTAFSVCRRLEKLKNREYEFRTEYEELQSQIQTFSSSILDQLRGSNELETVLTHDLSVWEEDYTTVSDNQLLKLQKAIELKQKAFVAHPNCQLILTKGWYEGLPSGWRDFSMARDAIGSVLIGCSFPVFSVLYMLFPFGWIKRFVSTPHVRFIFQSFSYFAFLALLIMSTVHSQDPAPATDYPFSKEEKLEIEQFYDRERGRLPATASIVLYVWVVGMTVQETKQVWSCGFMKYMKDTWNIIETAQIVLYSVWFLLKIASHYEIQREGDAYWAHELKCDYFKNGPPCFGDYYGQHGYATCCDPEFSIYGDCLNRRCNDGSIFDGENCMVRSFNSTDYTWLPVPGATLCPDDTAWDGIICRQLPKCHNGYVILGSLFSCCLPRFDSNVCEAYRCVKDGVGYDYNGRECYLYESGSYVIYSNDSISRYEDETFCEASDDYNLAVQTLRVLLRDCGGQPVDEEILKETIDALITPEFPFGYLELADTMSIQNTSAYSSSSSALPISTSIDEEEYLELQTISHYFNSYSFYYSRAEWNYADPNLIAEAAFAIANICSFVRLLHIITVSSVVGPLEISLERMTLDIARFLVIFIIIWWAFAMGLTQLYYPYTSGVILQCIEDGSQEQNECFDNAFASFTKGMLTLFWGLVGLGDYSILDTGTGHVITEGVGTAMYGLYIVLAVIILVNVLIAMLSNTFSNVEDNSDTEWKFNRSAIWIGYFSKQVELPIPFNIIPTPKHIFESCRYVFNRVCCHKAKEELKRKYKERIRKKNQEYQEVMDNLVARLIADKRSSAFDADDSVTQTDVIDIRTDVSDFKNEMLQLFRNVEGAISNCMDTCDEIFDTVLDFGDALDTVNGIDVGKGKTKIAKKREGRNNNVSAFQEKLIGLAPMQPESRTPPTAPKRRTRIVEHPPSLNDVPEPDEADEENELKPQSFFQRIGNLLA